MFIFPSKWQGRMGDQLTRKTPSFSRLHSADIYQTQIMCQVFTV